VHGWTGQPLTDTAKGLLAEPNLPISTYQFDYSHWSSYWAANPNIAACLADYVRAVSDAYHATGGDGRVIVVAHSMGGLAIRYATSALYVAHPIDAHQLAAVITFDTPQLGSPFGNVGVGYLKELWQTVWKGAALPGPWSDDGQKCLAAHTNGADLPAGCGYATEAGPTAPPPWLPAGVQLTQIAGDITINRSLFGINLYQIPLSSDGVVTVPSEHGYPSSGPGGAAQPEQVAVRDTTDSCTVDTSALEEFAIGLVPTGVFDYITLHDLQHNQYSPTVLAYFLAATIAAPCSHIKISDDQSALNQATESIRGIITKLTPATTRLTLGYLPDPAYGPDYTTTGTYPQVSGVPNLASVNTALRDLILNDQQQAKANFANYGPPQPSADPGVYASDPARGVISASSTIVSALIPTTTIFPGGNDGDHWVSTTVLVPSAKTIGLADLFTDPAQALDIIAAMMKHHFLTSGGCVEQALTDPEFDSSTYLSDLDPKPSNYQHFAISPAGLTVGFDQGFLAAEACDSQIATIPWSALRQQLSPGGQQLVDALR